MRTLSTTSALTLVFCLVAFSATAQDPPPRADSDRGIVDQTLENVRGAVQDILMRLSQQFGETAATLQPEDFYLEEGELNARVIALEAVRLQQHVRSMRMAAADEDHPERARRLLKIERDLERIVDELGRLDAPAADPPSRRQDEWLKPGVHGTAASTAPSRSPRHRRGGHSDHFPITFGDWDGLGNPFASEGVYTAMPALRYNRAEGLVLGIGVRPISWDSRRRAGIYGQGGYAFALAEWRYTIGVETKPGHTPGDLGLKLGANYHRNTSTEDAWKARYTENSLAAFFFKNDFFDYYETRGWTAYAIKRIGGYGEVSAAFRQDDYRTIERNTNWALFGGAGFRPNIWVDEGRMNSAVLTAEVGRIGRLYSMPRGAALVAEAEFGEAMGGDFDFNRYTVEGRFYQRVDRLSGLSLRARAGFATAETPIQKYFTLGGVGSVRGYPQNAHAGTRMLLANAEYSVDSAYLLGRFGRDSQIFVFSDLGWVGDAHDTRIRSNNILASVGTGVSLDRRNLRLEVAWPVGEGAPSGPSVWFRLSPSF